MGIKPVGSTRQSAALYQAPEKDFKVLLPDRLTTRETNRDPHSPENSLENVVMNISCSAEMKKGELAFAFLKLAEWTGLEPATPGVTGRYSNQLNYHS